MLNLLLVLPMNNIVNAFVLSREGMLYKLNGWLITHKHTNYNTNNCYMCIPSIITLYVFGFGVVFEGALVFLKHNLT